MYRCAHCKDTPDPGCLACKGSGMVNLDDALQQLAVQVNSFEPADYENYLIYDARPFATLKWAELHDAVTAWVTGYCGGSQKLTIAMTDKEVSLWDGFTALGLCKVGDDQYVVSECSRCAASDFGTQYQRKAA